MTLLCQCDVSIEKTEHKLVLASLETTSFCALSGKGFKDKRIENTPEFPLNCVGGSDMYGY